MKISLLAAIVLLLPATPLLASDFNGNAKSGKALYSVCASCHGDKAEGSASIQAPRLAGQFEWYLVSQLKNFKSGTRGTAEGDLNGAVMKPMADTLADDQAVEDVVAYIMTLKAKKYKFKKSR
ncbi:MAG: c-type cytochrome [Granulosicoccus sp.]